MDSSMFPSCSKAPRAARRGAELGRAAKIVGALAGAGAACALLLPAPAGAATSCSTHGLTLRLTGKASLAVVSLSAQGFTCTRAVAVARQLVRELGAGGSISLSGAAGIDIGSSTPCAACATETQVSLSYPSGTIEVALKGATKLSSGGGTAIPLPGLPFPGLPEVPGPNFPSVPTPTNPGSGVTTV
jgi:hypothetical protein